MRCCPRRKNWLPPRTRTYAHSLALQEIEKIGDAKALWSLHQPWETGLALLEPGRPHVDTRRVIWLATSNIGDGLVFEQHAARPDPDAQPSRAEYVELMRALRPKVSDRLGVRVFLHSLFSILIEIHFLGTSAFTSDGSAAICTFHSR
jgi:hypothetical protein